MQTPYRWLGLVALAVLLSGCGSQGDSDEFQRARQGGEVIDGKSTVGKSSQRRGSGLDQSSNKPVRARRPHSRRVVFRRALMAAVGFGSAPIVSDTFRVRSEQWLHPAVGGGPTLLLVQKVERPVENNIESTAGNPAGIGSVHKPEKKRQIKILVKDKSFREEDGALRVSYDDIDLLKVLNMEPVVPTAPELMPQWLKDLDGKRIRIRGFMSPSFRQTGLRGFMLGRDNKACCFPGRAKVYDLFPVALKKGTTTSYIQNRPFDVVGTFLIKPWIEDGKVLRIYKIMDAQVIQ